MAIIGSAELWSNFFPDDLIPDILNMVLVGLWTNLKQKMDERAIRGEKISDMRNRSTDDLGVRK
jgi:hypothetical protein